MYAGRDARGPRSLVPAYLEAIRAELELRADALDERFGSPGPAGRPGLRSVYLGGGTPSILPPATVGEILDRIRARYGIGDDAEITIEANPGPDDRGDLAGFAAAGVTRLSLGAQTFDGEELRRLGRRHRPQDVADAVEAARRAGIRRISLDLLYDIPGQTTASWERTLAAATELGVGQVSAYALTLDDPEEEGLAGPAGDHLPTSPGARRWRVCARAEQDEERAAEAYRRADEVLSGAGLEWYELSNWARPGEESIHNLAYWTHEPYEALGPGAHAFDGAAERRWNAAQLDAYLGALAPRDGSRPRLPPGGIEHLDSMTYASETVILALRLRSGLDRTSAAAEPFRSALEWGREHGLVEETAGGGLRLTLRGRLLSNEVFLRLLP